MVVILIYSLTSVFTLASATLTTCLLFDCRASRALHWTHSSDHSYYYYGWPAHLSLLGLVKIYKLNVCMYMYTVYVYVCVYLGCWPGFLFVCTCNSLGLSYQLICIYAMCA